MGIYIDLYGNVELRVPKGTTDASIQKVIESKWDWIMKKSKELKERTAGHHEKVYEHGEEFLYLGETYPILINVEETLAQSYVEFRENQLHVFVKEQSDEGIQQALKRFFYQRCKVYVEQSIRKYQKEFKVKPKSIRINESKSNWGTCNSKYEMTFNWKLAMAPVEVIEYVVVHEMCHMVHLNHERSFWRLVGKILPDYEQRKAWLLHSSWKMVV